MLYAHTPCAVFSCFKFSSAFAEFSCNMSSRCCCNSKTVNKKLNPFGLQRGSNNAFMNHTFSSSAKAKAKAETHSGNHVKKKGDHIRASTSQKAVKGKEKIQEFEKDSLELLLSDNDGRDSHSKGEITTKKAKNSAGSVKKNEDQTRASISQKVLNKGKEKITQQSLKTKHQAEKVAPKPSPKNQFNEPSRKEAPTPTPTYHIRWDGFEESEEEPLGQKCCLCGVDLAYDPIEEEVEDAYEEDEEYIYEYEGFPRLPEVAVLACGHVFHEQCLLFATPEELSRDPPCIICASLY